MSHLLAYCLATISATSLVLDDGLVVAQEHVCPDDEVQRRAYTKELHDMAQEETVDASMSACPSHI